MGFSLKQGLQGNSKHIAENEPGMPWIGIFYLAMLLLTVGTTNPLQAQNDTHVIEAMQSEALAAIEQRSFESAYHILNKAQSLFTPHQAPLIVHHHLLLSRLFMYWQQADSALYHGQAAYARASTLATDTLLAQSNLAIGEALYFAAGNPYKAIYFFEEAEKLLSARAGPELVYKTYYNLLVCNRAIGKIDNAQQYGILLEALITTRPEELSHNAIANGYYVIANNYLELYSPKALHYLLLADSIMEAATGPGNYYQLNYYYPQTAIYFNQLGEHEKALGYLMQVDEMSSDQTGINPQNVINQAWTNIQLKNYQKADALTIDYLAMAKNKQDSVFAYKALGKSALERLDPEKSIVWLKQALKILYPSNSDGELPGINALIDSYGELDIYYYLGRGYLLLAKQDQKHPWLHEARKYLWFSLETGLVNRPVVRHHNAQITLSRHLKPSYSALLDYYHYRHTLEPLQAYIDTAALLINHAKSTIIKSKSRLFQSSQIPDSLRTARGQVLLHINELKQQAGSADSIFRYFSKLEQIDNQISQVQNIYDEPVFHSLPETDHKSLIINYLWTDDALYAVSSGNERRLHKHTDMALLDSLTLAYYQLIRQPEFGGFREYQQTGHALFEFLVAPLLPSDLPEKVVIAPDEQLLTIPFEALLVTDQATSFYDADYWIRSVDISYAPYLNGDDQPEDVLQQASAASFAYNLKQETQLTNYLKNVEPESDLFVATLGGQSFKGVDASETNYKALSTKSRIQHLAVHGTATEEIPYLRFRKENDKENDGKLYEYEIFNVQLPAALVILTACESNVGEIASSEGSISLARAFLGAGARSVISSLWTLNDDASLPIFALFLNHYDPSDQAASALSAAKRSYLENADEIVAHPYFWASLVGHTTEPLVQAHRYSWLPLFLMILLVTAIIWYYKCS